MLVTTFHSNTIVEFTSPSGQAIELSLHPPSLFVAQNLKAILPDCDSSTIWVVLMLQQSRFPLMKKVARIEQEKNHLRENFIRFGLGVIFLLRDISFFSDLIDPRTGYPLMSSIGTITHDDTTVVKTLRGFAVSKNKCSVLFHPTWGHCIYPSVLVTAAQPEIVCPILLGAAIKQGWILNPKSNEK